MKRGEDLIIKLILTVFIIAIGLVFKFSFTGFFVLDVFNNTQTIENLSFSDGVTENITRYISLNKYVNVTSAYINLTGYDGGYINMSDGINVKNGGDGPIKDVTTNNSDFWVVAENRLYHFNRTGGNQTDAFGIANAGVSSGNGITTNNSDFWIVDMTDDFVYHFNSSGDNQTDGFYIGDAGANSPRGITTNGSDFWIDDGIKNFVYHFNRTGGNQTDGFGLRDAGVSADSGITTNGSDFWIVDINDDFVYHFNSSGDNQTDGFSLRNVEANSGFGITTNVSISGGALTDFWVVDDEDYFIYHFAKTYITGAYLDIGNDSVQEWNHSGNFVLVNNKTADFATAINNFLTSCSADSFGNCSVPFVFHSDKTGTIQYSNIGISYNDTQNPVATLTPSTNKTDVGIGMQTSLSCSATDNIGTPAVKILVDGSQVCSGDGSCSYTHTMATSGDKIVKCQALDRENNNATKSVTLTGTSPPAPAPAPAPAPSPAPEPIVFPEEEIKESLPLELTPEIQPVIIEDIKAEIKENKVIVNLGEKARLKLSFEEGPRKKPRLDMEFSTKDVPKLKHTVVEIKYIDWHYYFNLFLFVILLILIATLIIPIRRKI